MGINGKPTVGGNDGTWGTVLNNVLDSLNPTTTTGDIIYAGSSSAGNGVPARLGIGSASAFLVSTGSAPFWSTPTGTGSPVMNTNPTMVSTLTVNSASALDSTAEIALNSASGKLSLHSNLSGGSFNNLVSASDSGIIFYATSSGTGVLTIAPWSSNTTGIRITATNTVTISGSTTITGGDGYTNFSNSTIDTGIDISAGATGSGNTKNKDLVFRTGTSDRWLLRADSTNEAGSNAGSDFYIYRYSDAGASIGIPFRITRSTGLITTSSITASGTVNATVLQQNGAAVPTITASIRMAQGSNAGTTSASGVLAISTGLTSITNIVVSNGDSAAQPQFWVSSSVAYSGGTASVVFRSASSGALLNGGAARVNWVAFGT